MSSVITSKKFGLSSEVSISIYSVQLRKNVEISGVVMIFDQYLRIIIHAIYAYKLHVIEIFCQTIADIVETSPLPLSYCELCPLPKKNLSY